MKSENYGKICAYKRSMMVAKKLLSDIDFPETLEKCIQKYTVEDENNYFGYTPVFARKK